MSRQIDKILSLIEEQKTCNEICDCLQITNKQLYRKLTNLKSKGFFFDRKYFSNGEIIYIPIYKLNDLKDLNHSNSIYPSIITDSNEFELDVIAIADLHFGNKLERLDLLNRVYDYCIKNNINIIFCCGDILDGTFSRGEQKIKNVYSQLNYFIKNYPFDRNILTFGIGGDHDLSSLKREGLDVIEGIKNYRHDIVIQNYNNGFVNIKNDKILLNHPNRNNLHKQLESSSLILKGHFHRYQTIYNKDNRLEVLVPSLSDINQTMPTALKLHILFNNGIISNIDINQILFGDKEYIISTNSFYFPNKEVESKHIKNEKLDISNNSLKLVKKYRSI